MCLICEVCLSAEGAKNVFLSLGFSNTGMEYYDYGIFWVSLFACIYIYIYIYIKFSSKCHSKTTPSLEYDRHIYDVYENFSCFKYRSALLNF